MSIIKTIISSVLTALYQPFWFSVILSVLFMYVYKTCPDIKTGVKQWLSWFKNSSSFRRIFLLTFYTTMILFGTLLNRNMWSNPLSNVIGVWGIYNDNGDLTTECIDNMILFIPFIVLLFWTFRDKLLSDKENPEAKIKFIRALWVSVKVTFIFSFVIEFLQLFLKLGTWQLSDLVYNTAGGAIGGIVYWICYKIKHRKD